MPKATYRFDYSNNLTNEDLKEQFFVISIKIPDSYTENEIWKIVDTIQDEFVSNNHVPGMEIEYMEKSLEWGKPVESFVINYCTEKSWEDYLKVVYEKVATEITEKREKRKKKFCRVNKSAAPQLFAGQ